VYGVFVVLGVGVLLVCVILSCKRGCCDTAIYVCERCVSVFVMYVYV